MFYKLFVLLLYISTHACMFCIHIHLYMYECIHTCNCFHCITCTNQGSSYIKGRQEIPSVDGTRAHPLSPQRASCSHSFLKSWRRMRTPRRDGGSPGPMSAHGGFRRRGVTHTSVRRPLSSCSHHMRWIYIYTYAYMHMCIYVYMYVYVYIHMYI